MNKKEVLEIRKQFCNENCAITRIYGCYVDAEKNIRTEMENSFLNLPEAEIFKYYEIFRKTLSGNIGKNLVNLRFGKVPAAGCELLETLKLEKLGDKETIQEFREQIIKKYVTTQNYYIILIHGVYDIPGKASDNSEMFDASDEVYEYILCAICPVKLSKPGLGYNAEKNSIENGELHWMVEMPDTGFLYPAFNERREDPEALLYYIRQPEHLQCSITEELLGCEPVLTPNHQGEAFTKAITAAGEVPYTTAIALYEGLGDLLESEKYSADKTVLDRENMVRIMEESDLPEEIQEKIKDRMEEGTIYVSNLVKEKTKIKTGSTTLEVPTEKLHSIKTQIIDGRPYLVIPVGRDIEVNGIIAKMK